MLNTRLFPGRRIPFVMANELNECGLACLAAISEYFRGENGLVELRRMAMHSARGETLLGIRDLAERIGLAARGVRLPLKALADVQAPAILHWEMNHFVVLERVVRRGAFIMDPAAGRVFADWGVLQTAFTGVALELRPKPEWRQRQRPARKVSVLEFVRPLSRWRTEFALIALLSLLLEALVLLSPFQMQASVDQAVRAGDARLAWILGGAFLIVVLIQAAVSMVRAWATVVFGASLGYELMDRFVRALHRKSANFFLRHHTGDILSRARSVEGIKTIVTAQLLQALLDATTSVLMVAAMFWVSPAMAAAVVAFGVANVAATGGLRHLAIESSRRAVRAAAKADVLFLENARAARAIKLFGKEEVRTSVWRNRFVELTNIQLVDGRLMMYSGQVAQLASGLSNVALIAVGASLVVAGSITLGTMMMFFVFRAFFVERLNNCVNYLMELRRVQAHAERIEEVMATDDRAKVTADIPSFAVDDTAGVRIEVRDVWYRYGTDSPWILQGATLVIESGESVAITGPSGSGKSTLMNLMLGLLEPERGEILVNGRNLSTISSMDYASVVGVVPQDDMLFQGTVAENISFFAAPIDRERVKRAAEMANIAREIEAMPMQYHSLLAEAAMDISGGQKQRLFIARAIYHGPKVLFLDEATSHLDSASERLVSDAVKALQMTRVLIAHRKETIATAERVLVLDASTGTLRPQAVDGQAAAVDKAGG